MRIQEEKEEEKEKEKEKEKNITLVGTAVEENRTCLYT